MNKGVMLISLGWTAFIGENLLLSENRRELIKLLGNGNNEGGERRFHTLYNCLSGLACSSILLGFLRFGRFQGPSHRLFNPASPWVRTASLSLRAAGLVGLSQSLPRLQPQLLLDQMPLLGGAWSEPKSGAARKEEKIIASTTAKNKEPPSPTPPSSPMGRCPIDFNFGKEESKDPNRIWGLQRITRHPQLMSLGMFTLSLALGTTYVTHLIFWGTPLVFAFIGGAHQDSRFRRGMGGVLSREREAKTSLVPFAALIEGRQNWQDLWGEVKGLNAGLAFVIALFTTLI